jgi:uncharacterized membrane protein YjdF
MTINDFISELRKWKLTKYKAINFAIGTSALLIYEYVGRPIYRPYIYNNKINDFHIADTLGNTFGTLTTLFFLIAILSNETTKGNYLIKLGTFSVIIFELAQPLLGKPIDIWDIVATIMTGFISYLIYNIIFKNRQINEKTSKR